MNMQPKHPYIVGISGASGVIISKKIVDSLLAKELEVVTVFSNASKLVWDQELSTSYPVSYTHLTLPTIYSV